MKKLINSIWAYFGWNPAFALENFRRAEKHYANLIPIEQQVIDFVHDALRAINDRLRSEIKRHGLDPSDALAGKFVVGQVNTVSEKDKRFKSTVYLINGFVILRVSWKPNGFTFETNDMEKVKEFKAKHVISANVEVDTKTLKADEKLNVEVEALANEKIITEEKKLEVVK